MKAIHSVIQHRTIEVEGRIYNVGYDSDDGTVVDAVLIDSHNIDTLEILSDRACQSVYDAFGKEYGSE